MPKFKETMEHKRIFFSHKEKLLLISLVDQFREIVEHKRRDVNMLNQKQEVWQEITRLYNSSDVEPRSIKQLKKFWDNIKQKSRKNEKQRMHVPEIKNELPSPEHHMIMPSIDLEINHFEDDALFRNTPEETSDVVETDTEHDYSKTDREFKNGLLCGLSNHGTMPLTNLNMRTRKKGCSSVENEAELRLQRLNQLIQHDKEEHKLKIEILQSEYRQQKELHELKIKILQEELASKQISRNEKTDISQ